MLMARVTHSALFRSGATLFRYDANSCGVVPCKLSHSWPVAPKPQRASSPNTRAEILIPLIAAPHISLRIPGDGCCVGPDLIVVRYVVDELESRRRFSARHPNVITI